MHCNFMGMLSHICGPKSNLELMNDLFVRLNVNRKKRMHVILLCLIDLVSCLPS